MKKILCLFLLLTLIALAMFPVCATGYDPNIRGNVSVTVEVPAGFDEVVYLSLMDSAGGSNSYAILPESDYFLTETVMGGTYYVSAFVDNDPLMKYTIYRNMDIIKVGLEEAVHIKLTVTGGPDNTVTKPPETKPAETVPPTTAPTPTEPSGEAPTGTTTPSTDPQVPTGSPETTPSTDAADNSNAEQKDNDNSIILDLLISLLCTLIFVGIVAGIVYLVRKFREM